MGIHPLGQPLSHPPGQISQFHPPDIISRSRISKMQENTGGVGNKKSKTQACSTIRAEAWTRAGPGPGSQAQGGGAVGLRSIVFAFFSCKNGMRMPFLGPIPVETYV